MDKKELASQVLSTWQRHNDILLYLLDKIPAKGMSALPAGSKGRDVALQFGHLNSVRVAWLDYHLTGKRPAGGKADKAHPPSRAQLKRSLRDSGKAIGKYLAAAMEGKARTRMFKGQAIRWMGYLIAHESHHRGQILIALKQSGMRLKEDVAIQGVWGKWIWGD